jgi:hypothetical protein
MSEIEQSGPALVPRTGVSKPNAIWLISFGDLLTLLLCFFLSIVSFGPLNPHATLPKNELTARSDSTPSTSAYKKTPAGTGFALKTHGRFAAARHFGELKLQIAEEEYTDLGGTLSEEAQKRLESAVKSSGYSVLAASVSSCSALGSVSSGWFQSISRSLQVRRQLVDAGVSAQAVTVRALGSSCLGLVPNSDQAHLAGETVRTVIVLKLMRKLHG